MLIKNTGIQNCFENGVDLLLRENGSTRNQCNAGPLRIEIIIEKSLNQDCSKTGKVLG